MHFFRENEFRARFSASAEMRKCRHNENCDFFFSVILFNQGYDANLKDVQVVKSPNPQRKKSLLDFRKTNSEGSKQPMEIQFRFYGGKSNFMENIDKISEGNEPQSFTFDDSNPIEEVSMYVIHTTMYSY